MVRDRYTVGPRNGQLALGVQVEAFEAEAAALLFDFGFLFGTAKTEYSLQLKFVDAFVDQSCDLIEGEAEFFEDEDAIEAREL